MIISVEEFRQYVETEMTDAVLEAKLQALELSIRKYTNNNFQNRSFRTICQVMATKLYTLYPYFKVGDTVQISQSTYNDGIYTIEEITDNMMKLNEQLVDESEVIVTKVTYPADVKMGAVNIMSWMLKNEAANSGDTSKKDIQSETISRHSVTYATDSTESDIDKDFGVPKKHTAFLKPYKKARF